MSNLSWIDRARILLRVVGFSMGKGRQSKGSRFSRGQQIALFVICIGRDWYMKIIQEVASH